MPPRSAEAFGKMRAASRETILQAALELFAERGFAQTPVRAIAERAGISQGLMYNYFDSKTDLLLAIFERGQEDVLASFSAADGQGMPQEQLAQLICSSFEVVRQNRAFWTVFYSLRFQPGIREVLPADVLTWQTQIHSQLAAYLKASGHSQATAAAWLLFASIDGAAQHWALEPETYPLEEVANLLVATYARF